MLILFFIGLTVSRANPILPDCIENYTTFYNKYSNTSNILTNYTDLSGETCGKKCSLLNNCTSFNYFPEDIFDRTSQCVLLKSKYDPLLLVVKNNAGFFLKSKNDCSGSKAQSKNIGALILLLFLIGTLLIVCLYSFMRKKKRSSYGEI